MSVVSDDLWSIFDARRVKAPELKGLDQFFSGMVGWAMVSKASFRVMFDLLGRLLG